jgi:hypothetical protein
MLPKIYFQENGIIFIILLNYFGAKYFILSKIAQSYNLILYILINTYIIYMHEQIQTLHLNAACTPYVLTYMKWEKNIICK